MVTTEPKCGAPLKLPDGTVVATCNLRSGHLGKCAEVCWELEGEDTVCIDRGDDPWLDEPADAELLAASRPQRTRQENRCD